MSDALPRVQEIHPGPPAPQQTPNVSARQAEEIARRRSITAARFDREAGDRNSIFGSFRALAGAAGSLFQHIQSIGASSRRQKAQTSFLRRSTDLLIGLEQSDDPEQEFEKVWGQIDEIGADEQGRIGDQEQEAEFSGWMHGRLQSWYEPTARMVEGRVRQIGFDSLVDGLEAATTQGNVPMVVEMLEGAERNGILEQGVSGQVGVAWIRKAEYQHAESQAQAIYRADGIEAAEQWIRSADWIEMTAGDRNAIIHNLHSFDNSLKQELLIEKNKTEAEFIDWSLPYDLGQQPLSIRDAQDKADALLSETHLPTERALLVRALLRRNNTQWGDAAKGAKDAAEAERQRRALSFLDREFSEAADRELPHYKRELLRLYNAGDISRPEYDMRMKPLGERVETMVQPSMQFLDGIGRHMRLTNAAGERGVDVDVRGDFLYDGDERVAVGDAEGDLLDVIGPDGQRTYRSITAIVSAAKREVSRLAEAHINRGEVLDADSLMTLTRQIIHRELAEMMPGVQVGEKITATGEPLRADWQVAEAPGQRRRLIGGGTREDRKRFPDVESVEAGLEFVGEEGLMSEQVRVEFGPMGSVWTGFDAVARATSPQTAMDFGGLVPGYYAILDLWNQAIDGGDYQEAAMLAAAMLPRDTGALQTLRAEGRIWDYEDRGDGAYSVQFTQGGQIYPMFAVDGTTEVDQAVSVAPPAGGVQQYRQSPLVDNQPPAAYQPLPPASGRHPPLTSMPPGPAAPAYQPLPPASGRHPPLMSMPPGPAAPAAYRRLPPASGRHPGVVIRAQKQIGLEQKLDTLGAQLNEMYALPEDERDQQLMDQVARQASDLTFELLRQQYEQADAFDRSAAALLDNTAAEINVGNAVVNQVSDE